MESYSCPHRRLDRLQNSISVLGQKALATLGRAALAVSLALSLATVLTAEPAVAAPAPQTFYLLVFNQPVAGQEDAYNHWYTEQHMVDVVAVPGFVSAQRFVLADVQMRPVPAKPRYLVVYRIVTADLAAVYAEIDRRWKAGEMRPSDTLDRASSQDFTYQVLGPAFDRSGQNPPDAPGAAGLRKPYIHIVFVNPKPGQDAEFNAWYDRFHVPEMADVAGFTAGQRLGLAPVQLGPPAQRHPSLAMFSMMTASPGAVFDNVRTGLSKMTSSPSFDFEHAYGYTFRPITPLVLGDDVRRRQASAKH